MDDNIFARLADAALPFVVGKKLTIQGLPDQYSIALAGWGEDHAQDECHIIFAENDSQLAELFSCRRGVVIVISPNKLAVNGVPGFEQIDCLYAFQQVGQLGNEQVQATLPEDSNWVFGRTAANVWLDRELPDNCCGYLSVGYMRA